MPSTGSSTHSGRLRNFSMPVRAAPGVQTIENGAKAFTATPVPPSSAAIPTLIRFSAALVTPKSVTPEYFSNE